MSFIVNGISLKDVQNTTIRIDENRCVVDDNGNIVGTASEVLTPHGRLIDVDDFLNTHSGFFWREDVALKYLNMAPVIIDAEEV